MSILSINLRFKPPTYLKVNQAGFIILLPSVKFVPFNSPLLFL